MKALRAYSAENNVLCKDADSRVLKLRLLKMIYSAPGGVPKHIYIDDGKDNTAKTMLGQLHNDMGG